MPDAQSKNPRNQESRVERFLGFPQSSPGEMHPSKTRVSAVDHQTFPILTLWIVCRGFIHRTVRPVPRLYAHGSGGCNRNTVGGLRWGGGGGPRGGAQGTFPSPGDKIAVPPDECAGTDLTMVHPRRYTYNRPDSCSAPAGLP